MPSTQRVFVPVLVALSLAAVVLGFVLADGHPKLTYDSAFYLSGAQNLAAGHGLITNLTSMSNPTDYEPFKRWPPLYPILIAILLLARVPALTAATLVSAVAFGATVVFVGLLGKRLAGAAGGLLSAGLALLTVPYWVMASSALSDMLFTALAAGAVYFLARFLADDERPARTLWIAIALAAAAAFTRHIGAVLAVFGFLLLAAEALRRRSLADLGRGFLYGIGCVLPLAVWTAFNPLTWGVGQLRTAPAQASFRANLRFFLLTASQDFGVYVAKPGLDWHTLAAAVRAVVLLSVAALIVVAAMRWWKRGLRDFPEAALVPVVYAGVYMAVIAYLRSRANFAYLDSRLVSPVYPGLLACAGAGAAVLGKKLRERLPERGSSWAIVSLGVVLVLPLWGSMPSAIRQQREGAGFAAPLWRNDPVFAEIKARRPAVVVSNTTSQVSVYSGVPVKWLPLRDANDFLSPFVDSARLADGDFLVHVWHPDDRETNRLYDVERLLTSGQFRIVMRTRDDLLLEAVSWPPRDVPKTVKKRSTP